MPLPHLKTNATTRGCLTLLLTIAALIFAAGSAQAVNYYWDSNAGSAGLGNTAGVWGTSAFEGNYTGGNGRGVLDGTLGVASTATVSGDSIYFGTINLALGVLGSTNAIAAGGVNISTIVFGAGQGSQGVTLSGGGGTITLGTSPNIVANNTGINTIGAVLTGTTGLTYSGPGTLTLTGAETYTGTTTINSGGTLNVGNGTTGNLFNTTPSALTFNAGGGIYNVAEAAGSSQTNGALTFSAGEGLVISTAAGASSAATNTFASLAARTAGASGNFSLAVNTTSTGATPNKIVFTTPPTASQMIDKGEFFNGAGYAVYDSSGYLRAMNYGGGDANTVAADTITTSKHVKLTTSPANQNSISLLSLNLSAGGVSWTNNSAQNLNVPGILKGGGGSVSTISGGTVTNGNVELVIRTDTASDQLNIISQIAGTGALTKSGAGTLTLSGANIYSGTTTVNAGTLALSGGAAIADTGAFVLANAPGATLLLNNSETIGSVSGGGFSGGNVNVQGNTLTLADNTSPTFGGKFSGTSGGAIVKSSTSTGTLTLSNPNSFAGTITLNAGALTFAYGNDGSSSALSLSSGGTIAMTNNTILNFNGAAQVALGVAGAQLSAPNGFTIGNAINVFGSGSTATIKTGQNDNKWTFSGGVTGSSTGNVTLAIALGGVAVGDREDILFSGVLADGSGGTLGLNVSMAPSTLANPSFVNLSNQNTFTGPITVTTTGTAVGNSYLTIGGESSGVGNVASRNTAIPGSGYLGGGNYTNTISLGANTVLDYLSTANQILSGAISGGGALLKEGSGTLTLSGTNTYSGTTTVSTGTLLVSGNSTAVTNSVTVANGAVFGGSGTIGGTVTNLAGSFLAPGVGTLTLTNGLGLNGANLNFILTNNSAGAYSQVFVTNGSFVANGANLIQPITSNSIPNGTYTLITNVTARTGTGSFVFYQTGTTNWSINGATLTITTNAKAVLLTVSGGPVTNSSTGTLYWQGGVSSAWDISTLNWLNAGSVAYADGANVIFADNVVNYTVSGGFSPNPASVTFSNVNNNYTVSSAIQGSGTLAKLGSGTTTLSGANTYSGATTVSAGTLALGGNGSLANSSVTVSAGTFTEAATATISGATVTNVFYGTSATLSNANTYAGGTIWGNPASQNAAGILALGNNAALGTGLLTVRNNSATTPANSIQSADSTARTITNAIAMSGSGILFNTAGTGDLIFSGTVDLGGGGRTVTVANTNTTLSGVIGGSGGSALTKAGTGTLILNNANTYNGGTTLSAGNLEVDNNNALGTGLVTLSGGVLTNNVNNIVLTNIINLTGGATIGVPAGTNLTLGGWFTNGSTLTLAGSGTLTITNVFQDINAVTINRGTMALPQGWNHAGSSQGPFQINNGTLIIGGAGQIYGSSANFYIGNTASQTGIVNQTNGAVTFFSTVYAPFIGQAASSIGIYNLSGGSLTSTSSGSGGAAKGMGIGYANGSSGTFNLSGTGLLNSTLLEITRSETGAVVTNATGIFNQTNGTATIGELRLGGADSNSLTNKAQLNIYGGTAIVTNFTYFSAGNYCTSSIAINSGSVTLPAFYTNTLGTGSSATLTFNGGTLFNLAASANYMSNLTAAYIQTGGATFNTANGSITIVQNLLTDPVSLNGGLTKAGTNTLTLSGTNTYSGATLVSAGALALSGGALITNSASIVVASNAIFNVSGLTSAFTLAQALSSQTLSNSAPGAIINGTNNCSTGTISLVYNGVNPSFILTNGGMTLSASTAFTINNTGTQLAVGSYTLITNTTGANAGAVYGAVTTSPVTVTNGGAVGTATLAISGGKLVLTVASAGITTTNTLTPVGSSVPYSSLVTFTSTVQTNSPLGVAMTAGSSVVFSVDNAPVFTNALVSGAANYSVSNLPFGGHTIQAAYLGDGTNLPSTNSVSLTITQFQPVLSTTLTVPSITYGQGLSNSIVTGGVFTNLWGTGNVVAMSSTNFATPGIVPNAGSTNVWLIFTPSDVVDYATVSNFVTVPVNQASNYLALVAVPGQTNGYRDSIYFTATVQTNGGTVTEATGPVIFYYNAYGTNSFNTPFYTNNAVAGIISSVTISNQLPRGTNLITAGYANYGNYLGWTNTLLQTVTNHPPMAGNVVVLRSTEKIHIGLTNLVSQWSDPDGDTLSLTNITPTTTNGYTLSLNFSLPVTTNDVNFTNYSMGYSNSMSVNDRFGYTISDGYDSASGYVYVLTNTAALFGQTGTIGYTNVSPTLQFYGVPGFTYVVQRSPDLTAGSWVDISTNTPVVGPFTVTDTNNPSAFYRLKYQP